MADRLGRNCVIVGSFNPIHVGHIDMINQAFEHFDIVNIFVRYNDGVDLTDWDTKKRWFERISEEMYDGKVRVFKEVSEEKGKSYGIQLFYDFIRKTDTIVGETVDGFLFGDDYLKIIPLLQKEFPEKHFVIHSRDEGHSSTAIREDLEGHKDWLLPYVYEDLKKVIK